DPPAQEVGAAQRKDALDDLLPGSVRWMRPACQNDMPRALRAREQRREAPLVVEEQVCPLVRGETASEADGHGVQVELPLDLAEEVWRFAAPRELAREAALCEAEELSLLLLVHSP